LPFSTQWQDLKDLLRPAGRILRADIALAPDGRSKGWGTAVFATPQEAQNAIDTFDGWEVDGRVIKVRWDKFQGSTSQPSPQLVPTTGSISSPQMMHAQLSPAQTPRPNEYVAMTSNQVQPNWQSQFLLGTLRPMPVQPNPAVPQYQQPFVQPPYLPAQPGQYNAVQSGQYNPPQPGQPAPTPGPFAGVLYTPPGGWYTGYPANTLPQQQPAVPPQVRIPSSVDTFTNITPQPGQVQNGQRNDNIQNVYGI